MRILVSGLACLFATAALADLPSLSYWERAQLPVAAGAPPVVTGACAVSTQVGGMQAGSFVGAVCSAAADTLTFAVPAPNGRACDFTDITTAADATLTVQTGYTTTTVTIKATWAASDVVTFNCFSF